MVVMEMSSVIPPSCGEPWQRVGMWVCPTAPKRVLSPVNDAAAASAS